MTRRWIIAVVASATCGLALEPLAAQPRSAVTDTYVVPNAAPGRFPLSATGRTAPLVVSAADHPGVLRAVRDLGADLGRASSSEPVVSVDTVPNARHVVIIGTV